MNSPLMGLHQNLPDNEYRAHPGINASLLKEVRRSPLHAHYNSTHPRSSEALTDGRAIHCAVLEPERFPELYVAEPADAPRRPTSVQLNAKNPSLATMEAIDFWQQWDEDNKGREVITAYAFDKYRSIRDAVWENADARNLLHLPGTNEASLFGEDADTGLLVKARFDRLLLNQPIGIDLKSVQDASVEGFQRAMWNFGWYLQDAHYDAVHQAALGMPLDGFAFIAVEKEPPYAVAVYYLDDIDRRLGRQERDHLLRIAGQCRESGQWPGYGAGIKQITLPGWARKQLNDKLEAIL